MFIAFMKSYQETVVEIQKLIAMKPLEASVESRMQLIELLTKMAALVQKTIDIEKVLGE